MVTVLQLLSQPTFENFHLLNNRSGLNNVVSGTGFLEWESVADVNATFLPGEFVITTLSAAKDNMPRTILSLKALIDKGVAAIAVKSVYDIVVPEEIIRYADEKHVPFFIFEKTYIDDLIYCVKSALNSDTFNDVSLVKLKHLATDTNKRNIGALAKKINPYFYENCIACCLLPKDLQNGSKHIGEYMEAYQKKKDNNLAESAISHVLIQDAKSLVLIFTSGADTPSVEKMLHDFLGDLQEQQKQFFVGIGLPQNALNGLQESLLESVYAAITGAMEHVEVLGFKECGINRMLVPTCHSRFTQEFYNEIYTSLTQYDAEHNSNLHETLLVYIRCNEDIPLTAKTLYQHVNTVRYRLGKIKMLMGVSASSESQIQMYLYVRIYEILQMARAYEMEYVL